MNIRLLPFIIAILLLYTTVKTVDVVRWYAGSKYSIITTKLHAEEAKDTPTEKDVLSGDNQNTVTKSPLSRNVDTKRPKEQLLSSNIKEEKSDHDFTQTDVDLLKSLAVRRDKLKQWEQQIILKEHALRATEKTINKRISDLTSLQETLKTQMSQKKANDELQIMSLVKIYQAMKPKDAARIFEEIDMPILLQVVNNMKEAKVAPILAKMNPKRAQELTVMIAKNRN